MLNALDPIPTLPPGGASFETSSFPEPEHASSPVRTGEVATQARVLLVDDDLSMVLLWERYLTPLGFEVVSCLDGASAKVRLETETFDVLVSDICLPDLDGITLLRHVHASFPDMQSILVTASPKTETAIFAVEFGACHYLGKPVTRQRFVSVVKDAAARAAKTRKSREALLLLQQEGQRQSALLDLRSQFEDGLRKLWMAYQPIVAARTGQLMGYEALLRTRQESMKSPLAFIAAAERLGEVRVLGRAVRAAVVGPFDAAPGAASLFVNLHPTDLWDDELLDAANPLVPIANRVVLEITERSSLEEIPNLGQRIRSLRKLGFRMAIDDLGAGYAALSSVVDLEPEIVKIDQSLIRGMDASLTKRRMVSQLSRLCQDGGAIVVAEGIETEGERAAAEDCGVDLLQGYLLGRPAAEIPTFARAA